ncbi:ABC transporter transmembrane domain-containing protein, partial [Streptococcus suis]
SKTKQASVFWRLLSYLKAYRLLTVLALSFLLLTTVVRSLIPLLASYFIDHYISSISETAVAILAAYFALYLLQMLLQYFGNLWFAKVSYSIVRDIRRDAFGRIEKLGMAYFDQTPSGSIVSRITNDTESISEMFS